MRRTRQTITQDFYSRPCGRGDFRAATWTVPTSRFLLTPLREGRRTPVDNVCVQFVISTHAPAGGATIAYKQGYRIIPEFLLTPLREGRRSPLRWPGRCSPHFYSRPCGRGDPSAPCKSRQPQHFYSRPCGRGDLRRYGIRSPSAYFYSRPCGRGDLCGYRRCNPCRAISTHAPAGGATRAEALCRQSTPFLLTPLREGRRILAQPRQWHPENFYSRPCGRGDCNFPQVRHEVLRQIAER